MSSHTKEFIVQHLLEIINRKIDDSKTAIESLKEARDGDTKSSAGDKHETGRAMMQRELEQNEQQLDQQLKLKNDLNQIDTSKKSIKAESGSMVNTNEGNYFISIGLGKLKIKDETYFVISPLSPIGNKLLNKKIGEKINFQGREIVIKSIL